MLRQVTARQFQEWRAYADLEPFDEERADLRAASIVCTLVNLHRKKGTRPIKLEDCVLRFGDEAPMVPAPTPEQARNQVRRTLDILTAMYQEPKKKAARR